MQRQTIGKATLYCGDALDILTRLNPDYDALITDPPYSSGGLYMGQRAAPPSAKYANSRHHAEFSGDNRDSRGWSFWSAQWMTRATQLIKPGGYIMVFSDWRQLPAFTDIFQVGGARWRGVVVWDKTQSSRAPHTGYFRHQCEYVVWGSVGGLEKRQGGPFAGCITVRVNPAEKLHMTAKPVALMAELERPLADTAHILDPFMGSASTALPILQRGGSFTGIEQSSEIFDIACSRIEKALSAA